ncbi:MAG: hypothetical protein LLF28_00395 [Nitrospiraceae bacterium]|nr:hypothetical protein [Nitrospiraceae bacterium]
MRIVIYIILALLSLVLSILCFSVLIVSCSGHPPTTIGIWIFPVSFLGMGVFLYLTLFFWKIRRGQPLDLLHKELKLLPKKIVITIVSFMVVIFTFSLLSGLIVFLAIKVMLPDWIGYVIYALCAGLAIYLGIITYKKLVQRNDSNNKLSAKKERNK